MLFPVIFSHTWRKFRIGGHVGTTSQQKVRIFLQVKVFRYASLLNITYRSMIYRTMFLCTLIISYDHLFRCTLWKSNIAIENPVCRWFFPARTSISRDFPLWCWLPEDISIIYNVCIVHKYTTFPAIYGGSSWLGSCNRTLGVPT